MQKNIYRLTRLLLSFFALGTALMLIIGQVPQVRRSLFEWGMQNLEAKEGIRLRAEVLEGFLPFSLTAKNVEYYEDGKAFIKAPEITLTFSPWDLFLQKITFNELIIKHPILFRRDTIERPPEFNKDPSPWTIHFKSIQVEHLTFSDEITAPLESKELADRIESLAPIDLAGTATLLLGEHAWILDATLMSHDLPGVFTELQMRSDRVIRVDSSQERYWSLRLAADIKEDPQGLVSRLLNIPSSTPLTATLALDGPAATWKQVFSGDLTSPSSPLTGPFTLKTDTLVKTPDSLSWALLGDTIDLRATATVTADRDVILDDMVLKSRALVLEGSLGWDRESYFHDGKFLLKFQSDQLESACPIPCTGDIIGGFFLEGSFGNPLFTLSLDKQAFTFDDNLVEQIAGTVTMEIKNSVASGAIDLNGQYIDFPLRLSFEYQWKDFDDLSLNDVLVAFPGINLSGNLALLLPSATLNGHLQGKCDRLESCLHYLEYDISGAAAFDLAFQPVVDPTTKQVTQRFTISSDITNYRGSGVTADTIHLSLDLSGLNTSLRGTIRAHAQNLRHRHLRLRECSFYTDIDEELSQWQYQLEVKSTDDRDVNIALVGQWYLSWREGIKRQLEVDVDTLQAVAFGEMYHLKEPIKVTIRSGFIDLSPTHILVSDLDSETTFGKIDLQFRKADNELRGSWALETLPLELIAELYPELPITAVVTGEGTIGNREELLLGDARLLFHNVAIIDEKGSSETTESLESIIAISLTEAGLSVALSATADNETVADLQAAIPVTLSVESLEPYFNPRSKVEGRLLFQGRLEPLLQLFTDDTNRLTGVLDIDIGVEGDFNDLSLSGHLRLEDGTYESLDAGVKFNDLYLLINAENRRLVLDEFSAADGRGGKISAKGEIALSLAEKFPYSFTTTATDARLLHLDNATAHINGNLSITGTTDSAEITGAISIPKADLTIPKRLPVVIPKLDVTYLSGHSVEHTTTRSPAGRRSAIPMPVTLQISVDVPETISLEGRGLRSRWGGTLEVKGTVETPLIYGNLRMKQSEFEFAGKQLLITQGTLAFEGKLQDASISVQGELQLDEIRAVVTLKGPLKNPQLLLYSTPGLPEKEVVSLILFNKHSADITPVQGVQLAQTVRTLSGDDGGGDLLGGIRRSVGLDRLDIGATETSEGREYSLQAGKYLSRGVYVMAKKNLNADGTSVALEADLKPTIKLQAEIGVDSSSKISLKWKRSY